MPGLHHAHKRKRAHQNLEPFPHPDPFKAFMDRAIYIVGGIGPIVFIPQVMKIYAEKDASSIFPITWFFLTLTSIFWVLYGLAHKERPLIIIYAAFTVINILVFISAFLY